MYARQCVCVMSLYLLNLFKLEVKTRETMMSQEDDELRNSLTAFVAGNMQHGCTAVPVGKASAINGALLLLAAMALLLEGGAGINVQVVRLGATPQAARGLVTLHCICNDALCSGEVLWYRRLNTTVTFVTAKQLPVNVSVFTFPLTPQLEGWYSCVANRNRSSEIDLVGKQHGPFCILLLDIRVFTF